MMNPFSVMNKVFYHEKEHGAMFCLELGNHAQDRQVQPVSEMEADFFCVRSGFFV